MSNFRRVTDTFYNISRLLDTTKIDAGIYRRIPDRTRTVI